MVSPLIHVILIVLAYSKFQGGQHWFYFGFNGITLIYLITLEINIVFFFKFILCICCCIFRCVFFFLGRFEDVAMVSFLLVSSFPIIFKIDLFGNVLCVGSLGLAFLFVPVLNLCLVYVNL